MPRPFFVTRVRWLAGCNKVVDMVDAARERGRNRNQETLVVLGSCRKPSASRFRSQDLGIPGRLGAERRGITAERNPRDLTLPEPGWRKATDTLRVGMVLPFLTPAAAQSWP